MKTTLKLTAMLAVLAGVHAQRVVAEDAKDAVELVRLDDGAEGYVSQIKVPADLADGEYRILCEGTILKSGRPGEFACYLPALSDQRLEDAVTRAAKHAHGAPTVRAMRT